MAAKVPPVVRRARAPLAISLAVGFIPIAGPFAMTGVGLPSLGVVVGNLVAVDIRVAVDVDIAVTTAPVPAPPPVVPGRPDRDPGREAEHAGGNDGSGWVVGVVRIGRVGRIPPGTVNHRRIVGRYIDHGGVGGFDHDHLVLDNDLLFLGCFQIALVLRLGAQLLHGVHDIRLLSQEGFAQVRGPVQLFAHHREDLGKGDQRFHAEIPAHLVQGGIELLPLEVFVLFDPAIRLHHLDRVGRGHQDLREQRVGVESDGRKHLIQLFLFERRGCSFTLPEGRGRDRQKQNQESDQSRITP